MKSTKKTIIDYERYSSAIIIIESMAGSSSGKKTYKTVPYTLYNFVVDLRVGKRETNEASSLGIMIVFQSLIVVVVIKKKKKLVLKKE